MRLDRYIASRSSLPYRQLFNPIHGAVRLGIDISGKQMILAWDQARVGFPQMSETEIARVLAMPELVLPEQVKNACSTRILAVASQNAQINMASFIAMGGAPEVDVTAFRNFMGWVQAMRDKCAALIASNDSTYTLDATWPACPADAKALAARF